MCYLFYLFTEPQLVKDKRSTKKVRAQPPTLDTLRSGDAQLFIYNRAALVGPQSALGHGAVNK